MDKWKQKIINFFFEEDHRTEEERLKEDLASKVLMFRVCCFVFLFNAGIIIYLYFRDDYNIFYQFNVFQYGIPFVFGIGALYFDRKVQLAKHKAANHV